MTFVDCWPDYAQAFVVKGRGRSSRSRLAVLVRRLGSGGDLGQTLFGPPFGSLARRGPV